MPALGASTEMHSSAAGNVRAQGLGSGLPAGGVRAHNSAPSSLVHTHTAVFCAPPPPHAGTTPNPPAATHQHGSLRGPARQAHSSSLLPGYCEPGHTCTCTGRCRAEVGCTCYGRARKSFRCVTARSLAAFQVGLFCGFRVVANGSLVARELVHVSPARTGSLLHASVTIWCACCGAAWGCLISKGNKQPQLLLTLTSFLLLASLEHSMASCICIHTSFHFSEAPAC